MQWPEGRPSVDEQRKEGGQAKGGAEEQTNDMGLLPLCPPKVRPEPYFCQAFAGFLLLPAPSNVVLSIIIIIVITFIITIERRQCGGTVSRSREGERRETDRVERCVHQQASAIRGAQTSRRVTRCDARLGTLIKQASTRAPLFAHGRPGTDGHTAY